jgi:hypothetical protein
MPYYKKRRRKSRRSIKKTIKLYGGLAIVCFLIMATLSFIAWKSSDFVQEKIDSAMIAKAENFFGRKLTNRDFDQIEKKFGIKITSAATGGDKGLSHGDDFSHAAGNANDKRIKDRDLANRIEMYSQGKANPTDIEKVRKVLHER